MGALSTQAHHASRGCARLDLNLAETAVKVRYLNDAAQGSFLQGDRYAQAQIFTVLLEHRVGANLDVNHHVAGVAAVGAGAAFTAQTDLLPVLNARRDTHLNSPPISSNFHHGAVDGVTEFQRGVSDHILAALGA